MTLDELRNILAQLQDDATQATDEQLSAAVEAIRAAVADQRAATPSPEVIQTLTELRDIRNAVTAEIGGRAEASAKVTEEAESILRDLDGPAPEKPAAKADDTDAPTESGDEGGDDAPTGDAPVSRDLEAVAASLAQTAAVLASAVAQPAAKADEKPEQPQGRPAGRIGQYSTQPVTTGDVVTAKTYGGDSATGSPIGNTYDLAKNLHDKFRTVYQDSSFSGRIPIAHVGFEYPDARKLGQNQSENFNKMEAVTSPQSLVAAGGLCAPLETLYDVDVIGSAARPIKAALTGFQVERGGITYRPNTSAATAVHGAGQWTMEDDQANDGREKACYEVECPGLESEFVWAAYLCLQFSNITTRFDPETTASNIQQGAIAHARLADNLLLSKMAAESKLLTSSRVIGATRDLLVNVDKVSAYYRNRHRIDENLPLMWVAPAWVKQLMRADLARQMAAGDWAEALAPADSMINGWFSARGVTPVWHMDGIAGSDEVQTVTITGAPTGGTFTLTYAGQTTAPIAYNATAATVKSALAGLSNLHAEDVTVTGSGPYVVTFGGGEVDGQNVSQMTANNAGLTGGTSPAVSVATTTPGDGVTTVNGVDIPSQTYDDAAAGGAIPGFPGKIDSLLFTPGSWLFLDGGSLDLGLVRDSQLNAKNKYRQFMETFEGAAFRGIESLRLVMEVEPTGQTSGTKDLNAIND
jgi:hypothetical protein